MTEFQAELTPPRPEHQFDVAALAGYLKPKLPINENDLSILQFQGGQSNPTFLLTSADKKYVLRKKPPGQLLPSAHQIEREFKIIDALQDSDVPVPRTRLLCENSDIIGTPFYIMDHVDGRVMELPDLSGTQKEQRKSIYIAMADTLAKLHKVDWQNCGLSDFGKPQDFYARQIRRWTRQYLATNQQPAGGEAGATAMMQLIEWLPANIPEENSASIAHGDYRIGNLIIHPEKPEISSVLDWELSTIGHPLGDLAYCCIPYHLPHGKNGLKALQGLDLKAEGIPSEDEFIATYCAQTGRGDIAHWNFYITFALFRLSAILQGVYARAIQGNASSDNALSVGARAGILAETALGKIR